MELTGYEKSLKDYTKLDLVKIAQSYSIYYKTASGKGKTDGYNRLTKEQLISIIKNDPDYKNANPNKPKSPTLNANRLKGFRESLLGTETAEEMMDEILTRIEDTKRDFTISKKYYTYIYYAATPKIIYDRHPLIIAGDTLPRGFRGFNFHLGKIRQYNTVDGDRLVSGLFEISRQEFEILKSVPYGKLIQN
jgi:hypothetical protein